MPNVAESQSVLDLVCITKLGKLLCIHRMRHLIERDSFHELKSVKGPSFFFNPRNLTHLEVQSQYHCWQDNLSTHWNNSFGSSPPLKGVSCLTRICYCVCGWGGPLRQYWHEKVSFHLGKTRRSQSSISSTEEHKQDDTSCLPRGLAKIQTLCLHISFRE